MSVELVLVTVTKILGLGPAFKVTKDSCTCKSSSKEVSKDGSNNAGVLLTTLQSTLHGIEIEDFALITAPCL